MTLPNFLVIGAARAGTTSLSHYLSSHSEIFITPKKETRFFSLEGADLYGYKWWGEFPKGNMESILTLVEYHEQLINVRDELAIGEVCPLYMYWPGTAERIRKYIPDVKLIAILRNPINRAYSHYQLLRLKNREPLDFIKAIQIESSRVREKWFWDYHYVSRGFYYQQLKVYFDLFPDDKIRVFLYEEYSKNPAELMKDIYNFLGVRTDAPIDLKRKLNITRKPKNRWINKLVSRRRRGKHLLNILPGEMRQNLHEWYVKHFTKLPRQMSFYEKEILLDIYQSDIEKLQTLIQRDLSQWLSIDDD